jgi:hypothetical protein
LGKTARTSPQRHVSEIDAAFDIGSAANFRIRDATSTKQWRHSAERETNRDHQTHPRLRHTGRKRWQRLGALNHREHLLVEYGGP